MDRELITADALLDERLANHFCGEMLGFPAGQHPSHDVAAVDVEDHVEVVVGPLRRSEQLRDVPRPDLIGSRGHQLRFGIRGMSELVASFADSHVGVEDTVHRSDGTEICAMIQQFRVGFGWCLVGERLTVEDVQNAFSFVATQCPGRCRPRLWSRRGLGQSMAVRCRSGHADGCARGGRPDGG